MSLITGVPEGSNITLMNAIYQYPKKDQETGKYSDDYILLTYKDLKTNKKHHQYITKPDYEYYMIKDGIIPDHNLFFIEQSKVDKIVCPYKDLVKDIAVRTGNEEFFYDNIKLGNPRANQQLHTLPNIMNSDSNIEDHYRFRFDKEYENTICKIDKSYFDIEVDVTYAAGDFPEMGECPVNAVSCIIESTNTVCIFLLREKKNPLIKEFEDNINPSLFDEIQNFIIDTVGGIKKAKKYGVDKLNFVFRFFDEEIKLIYNLFKFINQNEPDFLLAWNMAFDIPYLYNRIIKLGYNPADIMCHPDFKNKICRYTIDEMHQNQFEERCDKYTVTSYTVFLDQMIQFASRRKGQAAFKSYKLDDIGSEVAGVHKLNYSHITHSLAMLPYLDYKTFVLYNIMDTIVQKCIETKTGDIDYIFGKCLSNNTRYEKGHRQTVYLTNRGQKEFYNLGYVIGNNVNRNNPKKTFKGALVGKPENNSNYSKLRQNGEILNIMDNMVDFDYKSLYPSITRENNMAPNTQVGKMEIPNKIYDLENPFNADYFSRSGSFMMDFLNGNYLEFGKRWFHLASIKEFMQDCNEYFTKVKIPYMEYPYINNEGLFNPVYHYPDINNLEFNPVYHEDSLYKPVVRCKIDIDLKPYVGKIGEK